MSGGFVKIYESILTSSVWMESHATVRVWLTMLARADANGYVAASVPGLAHIAHVTREECEQALGVLLAPDADSRTKDHDGRRIEAVDGGWVVLNARKYRDLRTAEQVSAADRVKRHREKVRAALPVTLQPVTEAKKRPEAEAEGDTEKEKNKIKSKASAVVSPKDAIFEEAWAVYPKRPGNNKTEAWHQWLKRTAEGTDPLDLLEATRRYAKWVDAQEWKDGRRGILMARTFFGPAKRFDDDWGVEMAGLPQPMVDSEGVLTAYGRRMLEAKSA